MTGAQIRVRAFGPDTLTEAAPTAIFPADAVGLGNAEEHALRLRTEAPRAVQIEAEVWRPDIGAWKELFMLYRTGLGTWTLGRYTDPARGGPFNASPVRLAFNV